MTKLGMYLSKRSVNKSEVSRKTGISKTRISELCNKEKTKLLASELFLIATSIKVDPSDMLNFVCQDLKL